MWLGCRMTRVLAMLRIRVVEAVEAGQYSEDVAASMGIISRGTALMWSAKYPRGGFR